METNFTQILLKKLYRTGQNSDVTFVVEGDRFRLHKNVLAASVDYFNVMLFGNTSESKMEEITLQKIRKALFQCVVEFIYTGEVDMNHLSEDMKVELLSLTHEMQFRELMDFVIKKLALTEFTAENIAKLYNMCEPYDLKEFGESCLNALDKKAAEVLHNDLFPTLSFNLVCDLISRDTFVSPEIDILKSIIAWRDKNCEKLANDLFKHVRWQFISVADFNTFVNSRGIISSDQYLRELQNKRFNVGRPALSILHQRRECPTHRRPSCSYGVYPFGSSLLIPASGRKPRYFVKRSGEARFALVSHGIDLAMQSGDVLQCEVTSQCEVSRIYFNLTGTTFTQYYEIRITGNYGEEIIKNLDDDYLRFGYQELFIDPQIIHSVKIISRNEIWINPTSVHCDNFNVNVISGTRFRVGMCNYANYYNTMQQLPTDTTMLELVGGVSSKRKQNEKYILIALSNPAYFRSIRISNHSFYNPPLRIHGKAKRSDEWIQLGDVISLSQNSVEFPLRLLSLILVTGKDLEAIQINLN